MFHKGSDGKAKGFGFAGFALGSSSTSSGKEPGRGYSNPLGSSSALPGRSVGYGSISFGKRRIKSEEEYFEDEEEEQNIADLEYLPAPGSPVLKKTEKADSDSDDSEDPLDAFMADIEKEVKQQDGGKEKKKDIRDDIEEEDVEESYYRYMEENPMAGVILDDDADLDYDEDGNPIVPEKNKYIDPLPPVDHSEIDYPRFSKNFYEPHEDIAKLSIVEVEELRKKLGIKVSGFFPPKPVSSFGHFGFDEALMKAIRKNEYTTPMPIQAQGIPVALMGRDIIGIAKTGSGKTAAFIWPMLVHIMDQKELKPGDGPIGLILAPTRELSQQIYHEAKKFGKVYNIKVVCAYGGGSLWEQCEACKEGAEIIVATPGRLIDLVKKKATNLRRVTFLVFDEADRMFDMGFEPQVRSIANHVRPDRQTLLFSATFRKKVERLARDILTDPIRVIQGELGEANEDITQIVEVMTPGPAKWTWLTQRLVKFTTVGSVLIFVTRKANSIELAENLEKKDFKLGLLHGDMSQVERNDIISRFKKKDFPVLVATDVAARGLDIPSIKTVVNYDVARDIDTHIHRIGRTGRAGEKGTAYTLITGKDKDFAGHLVRNLEAADQACPQSLIDIALQNPWFKKTRFRHGKAKKMNIGGQGLGFRERPGLGVSEGGSGSRPSQTSSVAPTPGGFTVYDARNSGPSGDRVAAMKQAFTNQFKSNFVSTSGSQWQPGTSHIEPPPPAAPSFHPPQAGSTSAEGKRRKKSRWE
ncbi:ATP-dependent RNA helicase DDX42-like [Lineus longissimus]|uniref:ATP-dependent RNA helicase DDX42-like n=1 Tax=Lineus longissimus TaxID=88925 RepID=UPI002B4C3085